MNSLALGLDRGPIRPKQILIDTRRELPQARQPGVACRDILSIGLVQNLGQARMRSIVSNPSRKTLPRVFKWMRIVDRGTRPDYQEKGVPPILSGQGCADAHPEAVALTALAAQTWGLRSRRLSDDRSVTVRGITPDPLPDGESEEVQEGERPPGLLDSLATKETENVL
jgi:hypothetical protein